MAIRSATGVPQEYQFDLSGEAVTKPAFPMPTDKLPFKNVSVIKCRCLKILHSVQAIFRGHAQKAL